MRSYESVKHTKPIELFGLLFSTILVFYGVIKISNQFSTDSIIKLIIALLVSGLYFLIVKNLIVKSTDFKLTSNRLEWDNEMVDFENVESYKIHWLKGAGLKMTLIDGTIKRLSSNSNFCNSAKFVELMKELDNVLIKYKNGKIKRKDFLFETKFGLYLAVAFTVIFVVFIFYSLIVGKEMNLSRFVLVIIGLAIIWSGVILKK